MSCLIDTATVAVVHDAHLLAAGVSRCALRLRWRMIPASPAPTPQAIAHGTSSPIWTGVVLRAGVRVVVISCNEPNELIGAPLRRLAMHWRRPAIVGIVPAGHLNTERWLRQQGVDAVLSGDCEEAAVLALVSQFEDRVGAEVA